MSYPKKLMSITELTAIGFSREDLEKWVHQTDFPTFRSGTRGTWRINTDYLDAWLIKHNYMKHPSSDLIRINEAIKKQTKRRV